MTISKIIIVSIVFFSCLYFGISFTLLQFNPLFWSEPARLLFSILFIFAIYWSLVYIMIEKPEL